jgi:hypothetical protein
MSSPKKTKQSDKKNRVEEVQLDNLVVDEPKKIIPRTPTFQDEDDMWWDEGPKKNKNSYDDEDGFDTDSKEEDDADEEAEDNDVFFAEKWPKSQGSRLNVDREKDGRRVGKWFNTFIDATLPEELTKDLPELVKDLLKKGKVEGKISQDELMGVLPKAEEDIELLDRIYNVLMQMEIELVDNLDRENLFESTKEDKQELIDLSEISDDSIRMYLNEIGRYPLIDGDEEVRLGRLIKKGDQASRKKTRRIKSPSRRLYRKEIHGPWSWTSWFDSGRKCRSLPCGW